MSEMKRYLEDVSELALMGKVIDVQTDEVQTVLDYILEVLGENPEDYTDFVKNHIRKYNKKTEVKGITTNEIMGMRMITFRVGAYHNYGDCKYALCYVLNLDCPDFSEFGDSFFEKKVDGYYHRVS